MELRISRRQTLLGLSSAAFAFSTDFPRAAPAADFSTDTSLDLRIHVRMSQWHRVTVSLREPRAAFVVPHLGGFGRYGMAIADSTLNKTRCFHSETPVESAYLVSTRAYHSWGIKQNSGEQLRVPLDEMSCHLDHRALHTHNPFAALFGDDMPDIRNSIRGRYMAVSYSEPRSAPPRRSTYWDLVIQVAYAQSNDSEGDSHMTAVATATPQDDAEWLQDIRRCDPQFHAQWDFLYTLMRDDPEALAFARKGFWTSIGEPLRSYTAPLPG